MICQYQRTVEREVNIKGIGLHSGLGVNLKLIPAKENEGINFVKNGVIIPAKVEFAKSFEFSTSLNKENQWVRTVEHLMSAFFFTGIDNVYVEIDSEEVPIMDGSAKIFVEKIKEAGIKSLKEEKIYAVIEKEVKATYEDRYIIGKPYHTLKAVYHAKYNNVIIGNKKAVYEHSSKASFDKISNARTYCFLEEVEYLKSKGLAKGGSLENAVVLHNDTVINPEGFRFEDEPVKHKVLDLIGDLYLLGYPLIGEVYSFKGGHKLNADFVRKLKEENAFELKYASQVLEDLKKRKKQVVAA